MALRWSKMVPKLFKNGTQMLHRANWDANASVDHFFNKKTYIFSWKNVFKIKHVLPADSFRISMCSYWKTCKNLCFLLGFSMFYTTRHQCIPVNVWWKIPTEFNEKLLWLLYPKNVKISSKKVIVWSKIDWKITKNHKNMCSSILFNS